LRPLIGRSASAATVYPTEIRSTGLGWIVGVGRVGAICGALVGTVFVAAGITLEAQYLIAGAAALVAAAAVAFARARHHTALATA
jgi:AAHS family 4-hydroxybenzoate transporter-like MFS transporter